MTRSTWVNMLEIFCLFSSLLICHGGTTIYVDASNKAGPWDGTTWPTAYMTLTNGAHQLMVANQASQGGHLLSIASGVYTGNVSMTNHSGLVGATNVIACTNPARATVVGGFSPYKVSDIKFEGLNITGPGTAIHCNGGDQRISIVRCNIYANAGSGIYLHNQSHNWYAENCNIYANAGHGVFIDYCSITLKDCNIAGNAYGFYEADNRKDVGLINCNLYGNTVVGMEEASNIVTSAEELNSYPENTNCIIANPGFSDLYNDWNFNQFYTNSPCYGAGETGGDIGVFQDAPCVPVSSNTYYVAPGGNDSRTKTEAQDPATPWASITNAAENTVAGDTVRVGAGTYFGDVRIKHSSAENKPIHYIADGPVIINGSDNAMQLDTGVNGIVVQGPFRFEASTNNGLYLSFCFLNELSHLAITNAGVRGIYMLYAANNIISNTTVEASTYGILADYSGGNRIVDTVISSNQTGIYIGTINGEMNFDNCVIRNNSGYGIHLYGNLRCCFRNSNIFSNGSRGMWVNTYSTPTLINCNITDNGSDGIWGRQYWHYITLVNCIVANNAGYGTCEGGNAEVAATNCCYFNNASGEYYDSETGGALNTAVEINALAECADNIVANPLFRDSSINDYRLLPASPCVDAGLPYTDLTSDLYGQPRLTGSAIDIGSYELPGPGTIFIFTCQ